MVNITGLGQVQTHVRAAAEEIAQRFGIFNIAGFASSGHITNSDHYLGLALDAMTTNGGPIANWAIQNAERLHVKYVIWNRQIWQNGKWSAYTGTSPHTDHVHISFYGIGQGTGTDNLTGTSTANPLSGCIGQLFTRKAST